LVKQRTKAFAHDRQVTQTLNSVTHSYAYHAFGRGSKLYSVDLATNATLDVTFNYGGDQKRRTMTVGGVTTGYNWDARWNVINEEDGSGDLARSYFHHPQLPTRATLAHVDGTSPATGAYNYYAHDHLGSTRALYNQSKALIAQYAYTPYGQDYASHGTSSSTHRFTGHDWNAQSGLYFAPHRYYDPHIARWVGRDSIGPAAGPNLYAYVRGRPTFFSDPTGLLPIYLPHPPLDPPLGGDYPGVPTMPEPHDQREVYCIAMLGVYEAAGPQPLGPLCLQICMRTGKWPKDCLPPPPPPPPPGIEPTPVPVPPVRLPGFFEPRLPVRPIPSPNVHLCH
jgi:RHS repeat-associated protein